MPTSKIKVLIADDHVIFLDGFIMLLETEPEIEVIGHATNGQELLEKAIELKPDVIVTDIKMPIMSGIEVIEKLKDIREIPSIVLSTYSEYDVFKDALMAGALGFIVKDAQKGEIIEGIKTVSRSQRYFCTASQKGLIRLLHEADDVIGSPPQEFSPREVEVIVYLSKEMQSEEIAAKLFLSKRGVDAIRGRLLSKMNVKTSTGIILYALKKQLISLDDTL